MYMSFTVVLNSENAFFSTSLQNGNQYLINWDFFPDKKYIMTFDFCSGISRSPNVFNTVLRSFTNISIDGLPYFNYTAGSNSDTQITQQIGVAHWELRPFQSASGGLSGIMFCSPSDNPPLYLPYKPSSNVLTVRLFRPNGTTPYDGFYTVVYVLRLHFTPID